MKCEIIPTIINMEGNQVSSKLFETLLTSNDRTTAKAIYIYVHSDKFRTIYGDWLLKKSILSGNYTELESAIFNTQYQGNIDNIKLTINIDENGEPIINKNNVIDLFTNVSYTFKSVDILLSDKAKQIFDKGNKNKWSLDKILSELAIPKEQKQLLLELGITDREQLALELVSKYGFNVEINTAKDEELEQYIIEEIDLQENPITGEIEKIPVFNVYQVYVNLPIKTFLEKDKAEKFVKTQKEINNSKHYSNLTVPGGTNYTENEISTPLITPSIKGHAAFSTDNGIGWFRSDEKIPSYLLSYNEKEEAKKLSDKQWEGSTTKEEDDRLDYLTKNLDTKIITKTRRIIEIQSDLFQKGRDRSDLVNKDVRGLIATEPEGFTAIGAENFITYRVIKRGNKYSAEAVYEYPDAPEDLVYSMNKGDSFDSFKEFNSKEDADNYLNELKNKIESLQNKNKNTPQNQFLQLLNKDNNWVTFFIKSIIQDSAKKGYEKVLFPKGETAAKIEGHETIADNIKRIDKKIQQVNNPKEGDSFDIAPDQFIDYKDGKFIETTPYQGYEKQEVTKEYVLKIYEDRKQDLKSQGIEKIKPIEAFYEIKVGNILDKQFGKDNVKTVTDEYGNQWREITIPTIDINNLQEDIQKYNKFIDIKFSEDITDYSDNFDLFSQAEINHSNKLLSRLVIDMYDTLKTLKLEDLQSNNSIKNKLINNIELILANKKQNNDITNKQEEFINRLLTDLKTGNTIYDKFKLYFSSEYNRTITDLDDLETIDGEVIDTITKSWSDKNQLDEDIKDKVSNYVKFKLANLSNNPSHISGIRDAVSISDIWTQLILIHMEDVTDDDYINTVSKLASINPILHALRSQLNLDRTFKNAYISTFKSSVANVKAITLDIKDDSILADFADQNRNSFPGITLYDKYKYDIQYKVKENKLGDFIAKYKDILAVRKQNINNFTLSDYSNLLNLIGIELPELGLKALSDFNTSAINNQISEIQSILDNTTNKEEQDKLQTDIDDLNYQKTAIINNRLLIPIRNVLINVFNMVETNDTKWNSDGNLLTIAKIVAIVTNTKGDFSFTDALGKKRYSVEYPSFITEFFKKLNGSNESIVNTIGSYLQDKRNIYSNWLVSSNATLKNGIFNIDNNENILELDPINRSFLNNTFGLTFMNGIKNIKDNDGKDYDEMIQNLWNYSTIISYLSGHTSETERKYGIYRMPSSDSPRMAMIKAPIYNTKQMFTFDRNNNVIDVDINHDNFFRLRNTMLQELKEMYVARDTIFDIIEKNGAIVGYKPKWEYDETNPDNQLYTLHDIKHVKVENKDGKQRIILVDEKNMPVGKVFKFLNATYKKEGKNNTFNTYIETKYKTLNILNYNNFEVAKTALESDMNMYLKDFIINRSNENINKMKALKPILQETNLRVSRNKKKGISVIDSVGSFEALMADFTFNDYIATTEINNLFIGNQTEFKSTEDWNKRASQTIKNGTQSNSDRKFNALTVADITLDATALDKIKENAGDKIAKMYQNINVADAFSYITLPEYTERLIEFGAYDSYKDVIKALYDTTTPFNPALYSKFVESLKFFYFDRTLVQAPYTYMASMQRKNSTMVLAPALIKGTQLEDLYDEMLINGIDQVDFKSAEKTGGSIPLSIYDNGFKFPDPVVVSQLIRECSVNALKLQLEVKPHLVDEKNKLAIQLSKMIFVNTDMTNAIYDIDGTKYNGQQLFDMYSELHSGNIIQSAIELLDSWGALKNGELQIDDKDNIIVDIRKIGKELKDYIYKENLDNNLLEAVRILDDGNMNLPFYAPIQYKKFSSILMSKITKNVIEQKFPGFHVPIVPDVFFDKKTIISDTSEEASKLVENGNIQYLDSVKRNIELGNRTHKLGYNIIKNADGKDVLEIEMLINPWSSQFITKLENDTNTYIDINKLAEYDPKLREILLIRIPTEGKQSMVVAKVIGFINSGSSQAILPYELVTQTGWDFDIDSVFGYTYNTYKQNDTIKITRFPKNDIERYEDWKRNIIKNKLNQINKVVSSSIKNDELEKELLHTTQNNIYKNEILNSKDKLTDIFNYQTEYINSIKETLLEDLEIDLTDVPITNLIQLKNELINIALEAEVDEDFTKYINAIELEMTYVIDTIRNIKKGKKSARIELKNIKNQKLDINKRIDVLLKPIYDTTPENLKYTKEARQNRILDIFKSILNNPYHLNERLKPNEMVHSVDAANFVNTLYDQSSDGLNPNLYNDYNMFRNINMAVRTLKANSVGWDAMMNILGMAKTKLRPDSHISIEIKKEHLPDKFNKESVAKKVYNIKETKDTYIITFDTLYNDNEGTWKDILGENISEQYSETTSHILDAVKKLLGFNINSDTLPVYKLLTSIGFNMIYDINNKGKQSNKFLMPNLFVHQPIIVNYIEDIINNNITTSVGNNTIKEKIITDYIAKLLIRVRPTLNEAILDYKETYKQDNDRYQLYKSPKSIEAAINSLYTNISANRPIRVFKNGTFSSDIIQIIRLYEIYTDTSLNINTTQDNTILIPNANTLIENIKQRNNEKTIFNVGSVFLLSDKDSITGKKQSSLELQEQGLRTSVILPGDTKINNSKYITFKTDDKLYEIESITPFKVTDKLTEDNITNIAKTEGTTTAYIKELFRKENKKDKLYIKFKLSKDKLVNTDDINYIASQINILNTYSNLEKIANNVLAYSSVLNSDKKKVGPDTMVNDLSEYKLRSLIVDKDIFRQELLDKYSDGYNKLNVNQILYEFNKTPLNKLVDFVDNYIDDSNSHSILTINGESAIKYFYPSLFDVNTKSVYPVLETAYINGLQLSAKIMKNISIYDNDLFKSFKSMYMNNVKSNLKLENINSTLNTYLVNYFLQDMNILNYETDTITDNAEESQKKLRTRVNGINRTYAENHVSLDLTESNYEQFKQLSLTNKLRLVQESKKYKDYFNNIEFEKQHILSILEPQDDEQTIQDHNRTFIRLGNQSDINMTIYSVKSMYFKDKFLRNIVEDFVRYSFYNNGMLYGNNISKFIPMELLTNDKYTIGEYGKTLRNISKELDNFNYFDSDFIDSLHKSQWDNINFNPIAKTNKKSNSSNTPKFELTEFNVANTKLHLMLETEESLLNSNLRNNIYVVKVINDEKILFKRESISFSDTVLYAYFPIEKRDIYEFIPTDNNKYKKYTIGTNTFNILTEDAYSNYIQLLHSNHVFDSYVLAKDEDTNIEIKNSNDTSDKNSIEIIYEGDITTTNVSKKWNDEQRQVFSIGTIESSNMVDNIMKLYNNITNYPNYDFKSLMSKIKINNDKLGIVIHNTVTNPNDVINYMIELNKLYPNLDISILNNNNVSDTIVKSHLNSLTVYQGSTEHSKIIKFSEDITDNVDYNLSIENNATVVKEMLENNFKLQQMYRNKTLSFAKDLDELNTQILNSKIGHALSVNNVNAIAKGLRYQLNLFMFIDKQLSTLVDQLENVNYELAYKTNESKTSLINKLREAVSISNMYSYIDDLEIIDTTNMNDNEKQNTYIVNESIKDLKELYTNSTLNRTKIKNNVDKYISTIIYNSSRNPNFITKFDKLRNDNNSDMTMKEMVSNITNMLKRNEDITMSMLWLDSSMNTGITMIDNVMLEYFKYVGVRNEKRDNYIDELQSVIKSLSDKNLNANDLFAHSNKAKRTSEFQLTYFDNETGTLISKYNWSKFKEDESNAFAVYNEYMDKARNIEKQINKLANNVNFELNDDTHKQLLSDMDKLTVEKNKLKMQAKKHIKSFYKNNTVTDENSVMINDELTELQNMQNKLSNKQFANWLKNKHIKKNKSSYYKLIPSDKYINDRYAKLTKDQQETLDKLKSIIHNVIKESYEGFVVSEEFFPIALDQSLGSALKDVIGYQTIHETEKTYGLNNEEYYKKDAPMMSYPQFETIYAISNQRFNESDEDYEKRAVIGVNAKYKLKNENRFNTLDEIKEKNIANAKINKEKTIQNMNKDPYEVMRLFIYQTLNYKMVNDYEQLFRLLLGRVKSNDFITVKTKLKGAGNINKLGSLLSGEREYQTSSGTDTNAAKLLESFLGKLNGDSKVRNRVEQVLNMAKQYTSLTYMALNVTGGIKNVAKGYMDIMQEALANEFISHDSIKWAITHYNITDIIANIGNEYSDNINVALMKRFSNLLELKNEKGYETNAAENNAHRLLIATNAMYFLNSSAEHFMQYTTLLAAMKSHKVYKGLFMNFNEFYNDRRMKILNTILDESQLDSLKKYLTTMNRNNPRYSDNVDYINRWTISHNNLNDTQKKEYIKAIANEEKAAMEEFNSLESVYDQFEIQNGRAVIKENSLFTNDQAIAFERRIQQLNHSLHGIYNQIDRAKLRDSMLGDLTMQFRAWMRPNWVRYFGQRWGRSVYNESLGSFRKGAFISLRDYFTTPFKIAQYDSKGLSTKEAFVNILNAYAEFFTNMKYNYKSLSIQERQNIRRMGGNFINVMIAMASIMLLGALGDDDEKDNSYAYALALYELNAVYNEQTELIPIVGWYKTIVQTKQYITPSERIVASNFNIIYSLATYMFTDEKDRNFRSGIYKNEDKLKVALMKNTPVLRQIHKMQYIPAYNNWYKAYNPLYLSPK